jgi:hypothetical protein
MLAVVAVTPVLNIPHVTSPHAQAHTHCHSVYRYNTNLQSGDCLCCGGQLPAGYWQRSSGFNLRPVHMEFMVGKLALRRTFLWTLFLLSPRLHNRSITVISVMSSGHLIVCFVWHTGTNWTFVEVKRGHITEYTGRQAIIMVMDITIDSL